MLVDIFKTNHNALPTKFVLSPEIFRFHPQDEDKLCAALVSFTKLDELTLSKKKGSFVIKPKELATATVFDSKDYYLTDSDAIIICNLLRHKY